MGIDTTARTRRLPRGLLLAAGALVFAAAVSSAAPESGAKPAAPPPAREHPRAEGARPAAPPAPEVRVQGYRILVERIQQVENLSVDFPPDGNGKGSGQQVISINLAVQPPNPKLVNNIEGLDSRVLAFADGKRVLTLQPYSSDDDNLVSGGMWRTVVMAQEVGLSVSRLSRLQGELILYP